MRKIYLSVLGFSFLCRLNGYSQTQDYNRVKQPNSLYHPANQDSTGYNPHALHLDQINFVSSYYNQNGDHSAVTGGIGTEKVMDLSNGLDIKLVWLGQNQNTNTISAGLGIDYHSAASQAYVSATGASKTGGTRIYPSLDWTIEKGKTGNTFGIGSYFSSEYNYQSIGADVHYSIKTDHKNGEFSVKLQAYLDQVTLIYPSEFIPKTTVTTGTTTIVTSASGKTSSYSSGGGSESANIPTSPRNTYSASFGYSQIINSRLQVALLGDVVTQNGYLSLPFHRVYFSTGKDTIERLPSSRFKLPIGARLNYFLGDKVIIKTYYRYYADNWGSRSNTANLEVPYKITPFFSISPFYRYYSQSASKYFAPYETHSPTETYFTSNYEYAQFQSSFFGVGFRLAPPKGVFGWQNLHDLELRYGHYSQTTDLVSDVVSVAFGFK